MAGSRSLICRTVGMRRFTARSLLVPKTLAIALLNKTGVLLECLGAESAPMISVNGMANGWAVAPVSQTRISGRDRIEILHSNIVSGWRCDQEAHAQEVPLHRMLS